MIESEENDELLPRDIFGSKYCYGTILSFRDLLVDNDNPEDQKALRTILRLERYGFSITFFPLQINSRKYLAWHSFHASCPRIEFLRHGEESKVLFPCQRHSPVQRIFDSNHWPRHFDYILQSGASLYGYVDGFRGRFIWRLQLLLENTTWKRINKSRDEEGKDGLLFKLCSKQPLVGDGRNLYCRVFHWNLTADAIIDIPKESSTSADKLDYIHIFDPEYVDYLFYTKLL